MPSPDKQIGLMGSLTRIERSQCGAEGIAVGVGTEGRSEGAVTAAYRVYPLHDEVESVPRFDCKQAHLERDYGVSHSPPFGRQFVSEAPEKTFVSGQQDTASGIAQQYGGQKMFARVDIIDVGKTAVTFRCVDSVYSFIAQ